jgi:hypothetical protein
MFEQLSAWDSKITLRSAMLNAIGFGFVAGMVFGIFILRLVLLRVPVGVPTARFRLFCRGLGSGGSLLFSCDVPRT